MPKKRQEVIMGTGLNPQQEKFCQLYISSTEFYGNGVMSYIEAYSLSKEKPSTYKSAAAGASRLLTNDKILNRINELLEEGGLNDQFVDKQLKHVITQNAELGAKIQGIREYNKLKQRIEQKLEIVAPTPILSVLANVSSNDSDKESTESK